MSYRSRNSRYAESGLSESECVGTNAQILHFEQLNNNRPSKILLKFTELKELQAGHRYLDTISDMYLGNKLFRTPLSIDREMADSRSVDRIVVFSNSQCIGD
ncbi:MAG: hypothetical protein WAZ77_02340 [Candidatus Nitrosopolaris sp.]